MGGSIVAMFATKYSSYVSMICLLAPVPRKYTKTLYFLKSFFKYLVAGEEFETDLIRQLRSGKYHIVLPETHKQFYATADALSTKKVHLRRLLANGYLKLRLSMLDQHKKGFKKSIVINYLSFSLSKLYSS
jgi:hypothetical protein